MNGAFKESAKRFVIQMHRVVSVKYVQIEFAVSDVEAMLFAINKKLASTINAKVRALVFSEQSLLSFVFFRSL